MNEIEIKEDETLEDLQLGDLKLIQKKQGFRFGMDSVLLADFAQVRAGDVVADFGSGTGILPLLMLGRGKGKLFYALEYQSDMAEMASRTMRMNHLESTVHIICADVAKADSLLGVCSMDAIVCNPPYGMPGFALRNKNEIKATARHQETDTLKHFFTAAFRCLKGKGRLFLVYPAPQMLSLMVELQAAHLEPKRFRMVYPTRTSNANLVLVEAVKDAKPRLHPMPPLIICNQNKSLTKELKSIYHIKE